MFDGLLRQQQVSNRIANSINIMMPNAVCMQHRWREAVSAYCPSQTALFLGHYSPAN